MTNKFKLITILIIMAAIFFSSFPVMGQGHPGGEMETETGVLSYSGNTNEGSSWEKNLVLEKELMSQAEGLELNGIMILEITFVLEWTDNEFELVGK